LIIEQEQVFVVYRIFRALETPFLSITYLVILDRLTRHAVRLMQLDQLESPINNGKIGRISRVSDVNSVGNRLRRLYNVIIVLVTLSGLLGVAAAIASAHFLSERVALLHQAAAACGPAGESTDASIKIFKGVAEAANARASYAFLIQSISDVVSIVLISFMYFVIGPVCLNILSRSRKLLQSARDKIVVLAGGAPPSSRSESNKGRQMSDLSMQSGATGNRPGSSAILDRAIASALDLRDRYKLSYMTSLVAFIARSLFVIFIGMSTFQQSIDDNKDGIIDCAPCGTCQPLGSLIGNWYLYNTWFSGTAFAITTPVAFSVGVWCMMTPSERLLLRASALPQAGRNADRIGTEGLLSNNVDTEPKDRLATVDESYT
jgi:hypothetical protein